VTIKGLKAFTILSDTTPGGNEPWPMSCDTPGEVAAWFRKAKDAGHTFSPLADDAAQMLKNGKPQRKVWVEDADGKRVSLVSWL
jgi:hypothetical protein